MGVSIVSNPPELSEALKKKLKDQMPQLMKKASNRMLSAVQKNVASGVPPANAPLTVAVKLGANTLRDRGDLESSLASHSGETWASAGSNKKLAPVLQKGKTIVSKSGKGLYIPANNNTRMLMTRYNAQTPGQLISAMKADGFYCFRTGHVFCAKKKKGEAFALFIIKRSVTIPARPFVTFTDSLVKSINRLFKDAVHKALEEK